jgi:hypothetical protein
MAAILISVNDIKYLKTWLAINEGAYMTGRRFEMPFILSPPTLALRSRQNNGPTPSGDYQSSLSIAGSDRLSVVEYPIIS